MNLIEGENARYCSFCEKLKSFSEFHKHKHAKYGYRSTCIDCNKFKKQNKYYIKTRNNCKIFLEKLTKTKVCTTCNKIKPFSEYYKSKKHPTHNLAGECITCEKIRKISWKDNPFSSYIKRRKQFFEKQKIYVNQEKKCTMCNKVKSFDEYWKSPQGKFGLYSRCKKCFKELNRKWHKENKKYVSKKGCEYITKRRKEDLEFRILTNYRSRITRAIAKNEKSQTTKKLVGCSIDELRDYLEDQFQEGMSWDNYGLYGWHIDHIRPCASFDLTDPEQQKECFHYTNLQPLWAEDNWSKNDKILDKHENSN